MEKIKLLVCFNQLLSPKIASGGDVLSTEIVSKFNFSLKIISPLDTHADLKSKIKNAKYFSSDNTHIQYMGGFIGGLEILYSYIVRTVKTIFLFPAIGRVDGLYLTGDFFCNTLPAAIYKIFHPKTKIFCNFFHLNPVPWKRKNRFIYSLTSLVLQRFSLFIIKLTADHIFVLTSEGKGILLNLGFKPERISISGAAVSSDFRKKYKKDKMSTDILYVGRLNKTKGIFDALVCLKIICQSIPSCKLGVIGACTKSDMDIIQDLLRRFKLNRNFHYFGYVSNEKKIQLMKSTPILIAPSYEEGFGIGILEGIASGMKVVAYNLPVYKLIFKKYKTYIKYVSIGNTQSMAKEVCKVLKLKPQNYKLQDVPIWKDISNIQERTIIKNLDLR